MQRNNSFPDAYCPITGLALRQFDEWKDVSMGPTFSCGYKILGQKTLVLQGRGYADLDAEMASIGFGYNIVSQYMDSPPEYLIIQDWTDYKNASGKARNYYIKSLVYDTALVGIIFCNATPNQEMSVILGNKLGILNKEVRICQSYREAALMAARFEQLGQIPRVKFSFFTRLRTQNMHLRKNIFNGPIQDLLEYLNSIDWTSRKPSPSGYDIDSDHPLLPIFDALTLIKSQLDKTTNERNTYMGQLLDHQERLEMELENRTQKIREGEQSFSRILEYSPVGIVLMDKDLCVTFINRQTQDCFGYSLDDLKGVGLLAQIVERIEKSENIILIDKLKSLLPPPAEPGSYGPIDIKIPAKDESSHHTEVTFTAIEEGYLISIVDVTKRKLAEEKLYSQSVTDAMTGLYNRRHYQECIENEFLRSKRYDHPLTLIIFDVDLFKLINDQYGHPAGDSVLCSLAELTRSCFRSTDLIFRIGGEEFAVLLPETEEDLGWMAAERFRCAVEENRTVYEDKLISHTISLGIGTTNNNIENVGDFIKQTDIALYRAKHRGRNCSETAVYQ